MASKELGLSLFAGILSSLMFLSLLEGGVTAFLFSYLAPLPLLAAGLALGVMAAVLGSAAGLAVALFVAGPVIAPAFAIAVALPVLVVVWKALLWRQSPEGAVDWYPPGLLLGWLTVLALGLLVAGAAVAPPHEAGLEGVIRDHLGELVRVVAPGVPADVQAAAVAVWVPLFPAMAAVSWLVMAIANAAAAQWLVTRLGRAIRPAPAYSDLDMPDWLLPVLAVSAGVAVLGQGGAAYLAGNAAMVTAVPYVLLGLAGVHGALRRRPNGGMLLALFYGVFFVAFGWAVIVVAGLGLVRHWSRLRRRYVGGGQEDE